MIKFVVFWLFEAFKYVFKSNLVLERQFPEFYSIRRYTGAYTMFQDNHFVYITIKTPQTEENLLYKMAQPLFWTSCDHFEFYAF